ncbi:MAG: endonuclease/exonuclease/phosphatase family metal-dependent hydrolase [Flavobacteriaceae bacterium]|jgi:endonuclease/exonuclease/phosphatase family metal-dependent hydrolase
MLSYIFELLIFNKLLRHLVHAYIMRKLLTLLLISLTFNGVAQNSDSISVLSWNVFLRPAILADGQLNRVDSISEYLLASNADALILQEVFHKKSRKRLIKQLNSTYPFHTSMGKRSFFGVPSGVCIFSKDSILIEKEMSYSHAKGSDRMARKGVWMIKIDHSNRNFALFGTHLQAGGGDKRTEVRKNQLSELSTFVLANCHSSTSIIAGDFNITQQLNNYTHALSSLDASNFKISGELKNTANFTDHSLTNSSGSSKWIDFILLKKEHLVNFKSSHIEEPRCRLKKKNQRISDHNPIITVFQW